MAWAEAGVVAVAVVVASKLMSTSFLSESTERRFYVFEKFGSLFFICMIMGTIICCYPGAFFRLERVIEKAMPPFFFLSSILLASTAHIFLNLITLATAKSYGKKSSLGLNDLE